VSHGKDPERGVFFIVRKDGQVLIRPHVPVSMTNDVTIAVYGNRRILRRGVRTADADPAKAVDVHPRTAFGLSRDRKTFVILAVDGRQPGYSEGATCADLADLLLREGCWDAINMDGGGSTSLVIYDRKHNRPIMLNHHANGYVRKTALNLGLIFTVKE
ncbi:MAG: phosphodiester glycosidase family protein, partial [Kiritimatiellae bacterium]|nr:phosphodiester glycosidase family protein [Kiritimatiellia bacterium]